MIPVLETERLILRAPTLADAPGWHDNFADYAVIGELAAAVPWPYPADGVPRFLETLEPELGQTRWLWGLFFKGAPSALIGVVDLWRQEKPENRGFWLAKIHWGAGLMTEATTAVNDYAFDHLGFDRLILSNAVGNVRSRRIKEKSGARLLRVEPAQLRNPAYTEKEIWELTKADWARLIPPGRR